MCFSYAAAAAMRLARFNSRAATADKNYFEGLPSPSAAAVVAALIWLASDQTNVGLPGLCVAFAITASAGALMVSRFPFYSFKVNPFAKIRYSSFVLMALVFLLILAHPPIALLTLFGVYALHAPVIWAYRKLFRRRVRPAPHA